jgi:hypothetical protein
VSAVDDLLAGAGSELLHAPAPTSRTIEAKSDQWRRHVYTDDLPGDQLVPDAEPVSLVGLTSQIAPIKNTFEDYAVKVVSEWAVANHAVWSVLPPAEAAGLIAYERTRKLNRDANRGTSIHKVIDQIREGDTELFLANPDAAPYFAAVQRFVDECQPEFLLGEVAVFNRTSRYAGKFDTAMRLHGSQKLRDLGLAIGDWKTRAKHNVYQDNAAQLGGYANAEYYVLDGQRHPMPAFDCGVVVTFAPDGTYDIHPIDLDQAWPLCEAAVRCYQAKSIAKPIGKPLGMADTQVPQTAAPTPVTVDGNGAGAHETSTAPAPSPAPAPTVEQLVTNLDASIAAARAAQETAAAGDVPPGVTPEWIADQAAAIRARLAAVVNAAGGIPAGFTWPEQVRKFPDGGPQSWAGLVLANRFVCALEAECGMPFVEVLHPPVLEERKPAADLVGPTPSPAPVGVSEALVDLDARVKVLPGDIRGMVNDHLATLGFGTDPRKWNDDQVALVAGELDEFEQLFVDRITALYAACDRHDDPTIAACIDLVCPPTQVGTWPVESFTAQQAGHFEALLAAITDGVVAVVDGEVRPTPAADRLLIAIYGGVGAWKAQFVTDMKALAVEQGLPKPTSSAKAAGDPLLVALLAASHQQQPHDQGASA